MSDSLGYTPWSDNPNAPQMTGVEYIMEKSTFSGNFISSILYGVLIMLFFQCMAAFLNPDRPRGEGTKWWLVSYTVAMFSFVTVHTLMNLHIQSISFIDNRQDGQGWPISGPLDYQFEIRQKALGFIPNVMFTLNNWLADGLLIYRCYIIYFKNRWAVVFPCFMYFISLGTSIVSLYFQHYGYISSNTGLPRIAVLYISISVSLNVILTLMIVVRLVLHGRNIRAATGSAVGVSGLYKVVSTMLIESCALFAVSSLLVVGTLAAAGNYVHVGKIVLTGDYLVNTFFPILAETQVIASLLIIQRVANRSALTGRAITTGCASSFNVGSRGELTSSDGIPLSGYLTSSASGYGKNPGERGVVVDDQTPSRQ